MAYMKFYGIMSLNEAKDSLMVVYVDLLGNKLDETKSSLMTCV